MKQTFLYILLLAASASHAVLADTLSGHVRTTGGQPVPQAVVSDGYSVVQTDGEGRYEMSRHDSAQFVFLSVPEAYEMPVDENGSPLLYARIGDKGDFTHDFTLTPFADGGAADSTHVLVAISDPQVRNDYDSWRFRNETIEDILELKASYPAGTRFYGAVVGDLVWDDYDRMAVHKAACEVLGMPVFQVIGNHDHDMYSCGDRAADHYFKDAFGPTYYSFNRGKIHYVVLDNIDYIGCGTKDYTERVSLEQIAWLEKDLAFVPAEKAVVVLAHAPFEGSNVGNRQQVYNLLEGRRTTQHIITGHHHRLTNYEISNRLYDHTLGASMGACWAADYCADGAPSGYGVFEAGDRGFNEWYYKATGRSRDFQLNAYPANHVDTGDDKAGCIVANVWNFDSRWSVHIYENGVKKTMQQYSGHDPMMRDLLLDDGDTRPNYPGSDGGTTVSQNPGSAASNHLFYYKPDDPDAEFVVEVTDRFGHVYRSEPVLRNMMVASFTEEDGEWVYRNDFNTLPRFANQFDTGSGLAKGTFVQGHTPAGWYASTSGTMQPNVARWGQFNYLRINNGDQSAAGLYSYGNGNTQAQEEQDADRALGSLVSTVSHRDICYGVAIENNTGQVITTLQVSYTGEMWRAGSDPAAGQQLTFAYGKREDNHSLRDREEWIGELDGLTPVDSLSFHSPAGNTAAEAATPNTAINGNDPRNRTRVDGSIELNLEPGAVAILRWEDADDSGSDHALAIDDLCLRATLAPASGLPPAHVIGTMLYTRDRTVVFSHTPRTAVQVYDTAGRCLYNRQPHTPVLDLSVIATHGLYIICMEGQREKVIF